jgi:ATP-dependent DNA ligase
MHLPVKPPILPMLAKRVGELPVGGTWIFEPKWDGFRALVFRDGNEILIQSRDEKSLNRYFPELLEPLRSQLPRAACLTAKSSSQRMARSTSTPAAPRSGRQMPQLE